MKTILILAGLISLVVFQACSNSIGEPIERKSSAITTTDQNIYAPTDPSIPVGILKSWDDPFPKGISDKDCLNNPKYNLCLVEKNPVFATGSNFSPALTIDNSTPTKENKIFTLGLMVPSSGTLENKHFRIVAPNVVARAQGGGWKFRLQGDTNHFVSQIQTFYWLNQLVSQVTYRTGRFFYSNKQAPVKAFQSNLKNNANFDGIGINLGYRNHTDGKGDVALDISVTIHEAGHGNLFVATKSAAIDKVCTNKKGCFGAIHEGVGDITAFMFLNTNGTVGEFFTNNINGLRSPVRTLQAGKTAENYFTESNGSVHRMGAVYAAIWYSLWSQGATDKEKQNVEILFTNHLPTLQSTDTFVTAYINIVALIPSIFPNPDVIKSQLKTVYEKFGIAI